MVTIFVSIYRNGSSGWAVISGVDSPESYIFTEEKVNQVVDINEGIFLAYTVSVRASKVNYTLKDTLDTKGGNFNLENPIRVLQAG